MKKLWVDVRPWDQALAVAALEAGADAVLLAPGDAPRLRELGRLPVAAPDGDLVPGRDFVELAIRGKADEEAAAREGRQRPVLVSTPDWTVIPLENLLAQGGIFLAVVRGLAEARTALGVLERGADGIVFAGRDAGELRRTAELIRAAGERLALRPARVAEVRVLGLGDRVCVDTCTGMGPGQGLLVGNSAAGLLLVHAETEVNPYVEPRPFRVNAGGLHAYLRVPGGKTRYLSELKAGDEVLVAGAAGRGEPAIVGRVKIERRPLMLVRARAGEAEAALVLQNAETIRLVAPGGQPRSVAKLEPGDEVLALFEEGGRHFGMKIEETIQER